jgi:hypothetical protein
MKSLRNVEPTLPRPTLPQSRRDSIADDGRALTRGEAFARDGDLISVSRRPSSASLIKRLATATAACGALLAATVPGVAPASSITYIKDSQVWITDPDGKVQKQLTTNGTDLVPYRSPSQTDEGVIYTVGPNRAFFRLTHSGEYAASPLLTPGCIGGPPPTSAQVRPSGGRIALSYVATPGCGSDVSPRTTAVSADTSTEDESANPFQEGYARPRWVSQTHYAMITTDRHHIDVEAVDHTGQPREWIGLGTNNQGQFDAEIESFDVDRTGRYALIEVEPDNGDPIQVYFWDDKGQVPTGNGELVCSFEVPAGGPWVNPRFSPDGKQVVYTAPDGIHVRDRPTPGGPDGSCLLPPDKRIVEDAHDADWGAKSLPPVMGPPDPPPPPPPPPPNPPKPPVDPPKPPEIVPPRNTPDTAAPVPTLNVKAGKLRAALKKGHKVTVECNEACSIDAQLLNRTTVVGTAKGKLAAAGKSTLTVKFTKKAQKSLKKKKSLKLQLQVKVTDAAGNRATKTVPLTLKR